MTILEMWEKREKDMVAVIEKDLGIKSIDTSVSNKTILKTWSSYLSEKAKAKIKQAKKTISDPDELAERIESIQFYAKESKYSSLMGLKRPLALIIDDRKVEKKYIKGKTFGEHVVVIIPIYGFINVAAAIFTDKKVVIDEELNRRLSNAYIDIDGSDCHEFAPVILNNKIKTTDKLEWNDTWQFLWEGEPSVDDCTSWNQTEDGKWQNPRPFSDAPNRLAGLQV